jgi:GTP-binding protein HflX
LLVGSGKVEEISGLVESQSAELVVFDQPLLPSQERNLERQLGCRVLDRTALILDIFAQRARSHEGKLQVELAQLKHLSTRLVRGWTHLERQKGGIGLRGGPGESQLETDRRLLAERIRKIERHLGRVDRRRDIGRHARRKASMPTVALVGYTNAGKSTLFNRLTHSGVRAADQLFATLDPTMRRLRLPVGGSVILADTVGFIRDLPHALVAAFRATLQETVEATLILHVVDAASPARLEQIAQVEEVLDAIGAGSIPRLEVYNKADLLSQPPLNSVFRNQQGEAVRVWISALAGSGMDDLRGVLSERTKPLRVRAWLRLPHREGRLRAKLFELGMVVSEAGSDTDAWLLEVAADPADMERLSRCDGLNVSWLQARDETTVAGLSGRA